MTIGIGTEASIVVQLSLGSSCGRSIQGIATLLAYQHPLQQCRFDRSAGRMMLVLGQLFLCQSKSLFTHQRRNGHFDPVRARPITMTVASVRGTVPDRKSTRLNSSHLVISYAVVCLK